MTDPERQSRNRLVSKILQGGLVTVLTAPTIIGPFVGGWLASQEPNTSGRDVVASATAGLLGALPWGVGAFLAARGTLGTTGFDVGPVHVGIDAVSPSTLVLWQELGIALGLAVTVVGLAVCGGLIRSVRHDTYGDSHSGPTGE